MSGKRSYAQLNADAFTFSDRQRAILFVVLNQMSPHHLFETCNRDASIWQICRFNAQLWRRYQDFKHHGVFDYLLTQLFSYVSDPQLRTTLTAKLGDLIKLKVSNGFGNRLNRRPIDINDVKVAMFTQGNELIIGFQPLVEWYEKHHQSKNISQNFYIHFTYLPGDVFPRWSTFTEPTRVFLSRGVFTDSWEDNSDLLISEVIHVNQDVDEFLKTIGDHIDDLVF